MENITNEEMFINAVYRINRYLIIMGVFFLVYFLLKTKVDIFLFLLALFNVAFALLSFKHLAITNRLALELKQIKIALGSAAKETHKMSTV